MKKLIVPMMISLLVTVGCGKADSGKETKAVSDTQINKIKDEKEKLIKKINASEGALEKKETFYSDSDDAFSVTLPASWEAYEDPEELVEGANFSFNKDEWVYGNIAMHEAIDFDSFKEFSELSEAAFDMPEDDQVDKSDVDFGEFKGKRYLFDEKIDGYKMKFVIYLLESENQFIEAQIWSQKSKFDKQFDESEGIIKSITRDK